MSSFWCLCSLLGISEVVGDYVMELRRTKEQRLQRETSSQTKDDIAFAQSVSFLSGELLLLGSSHSVGER
jgi:hypothetical protein